MKAFKIVPNKPFILVGLIFFIFLIYTAFMPADSLESKKFLLLLNLLLVVICLLFSIIFGYIKEIDQVERKKNYPYEESF